MFDSNRRKYPRANYLCQLTMWLQSGTNETISTNTTNIGLGGICVHLDHAIDVGIKVDIQLNFTNPTTPLRCHGKVVRSQMDGQKDYNIGIQFDPLSELKYAFLDGKVAELIASEKKAQS